MVENTIKKYCKSQDLTLKQLAEKVEMTEAGLHRAMKRKTLKLKTLERIAEVLDIPVVNLFREEEVEVMEPDKEYKPRSLGTVEERLAMLENEVARLKKRTSTE